MARGRLISRTLGSSRKFAALQKQAGRLGEFAQSLYPLVVVNADDFGRLPGDPFTVKYAMFPTSARQEDDFAAALTAMHHVGLIEWYEVGGQQVIEIVGFDAHQPNLHKRAENSKFPGNPGSSRKPPENPGKNLTEQNLTEPKGTEEKRTALMRRGDDAFSAFWLVYPKKKSRSDAEKAWRKLAPSPELTQRIMDAVAAQRNSPDWLKDGGKYIPYPASWLNGRRWEDEQDDSQSSRQEQSKRDPNLANPDDLLEPAQRVKAYVDWYGRTYERIFGVGYLGPETDYKHAIQLVSTFSEHDLQDATLVWFGLDDPYASNGTRTIAKFASRATGCLQQARAVVGRSA